MTNKGYPIKATETTLEIVELLSEHGRKGVTNIANELGLSKSAVFNQLKTLEQRGYVVQKGQKYELGFRCLTHGVRTRRRSPIFQIGVDLVDDLAGTTETVVSLVVPVNSDGVHLYVTGKQADAVDIVAGTYEPLSTFAAGQAILSQMTPERRNELLKDVESTTANSIDRDEFEFQSIRSRQVAFGNREHDRVWRTIAAPIVSAEQQPLGAVEVMCPEEQFTGRTSEVETPGLLFNVVKSIENDLLTSDQ